MTPRTKPSKPAPVNSDPPQSDPERTLLDLIEAHEGKHFEQSNEAETRLLLIDQILEHVLGWPKTAFHPEESRFTGETRLWLDYHLEAPGAARLIVEAKRKSKTFCISHNRPTRSYKLASLRNSHGQELRAAIQQASNYATSTGTPGFVVTNGTQWIAGLAFWPHVDPDNLDAIVFHDLNDILENLPEFIDHFSPDSVRNDALVQWALQSHGRTPPFCESINSSLKFNPPSDERNYLAAPLGTVMRICFDDLDAGNEMMLDRCYVTNELTDGYVARFETFVGHTLPYDLRSSTKSTARLRSPQRHSKRQ